MNYAWSGPAPAAGDTWFRSINEERSHGGVPTSTADDVAQRCADLDRENQQLISESLELARRLEPLCPCGATLVGARRDCPLHGDETFSAEVIGLRKMLQDVLFLLNSHPGRWARPEHVQRLHLVQDHLEQMRMVPGIAATITDLTQAEPAVKVGA